LKSTRTRARRPEIEPSDLREGADMVVKGGEKRFL